MAIDTSWANVSLLCPFSTDLQDVKGHAVTAVGGAALSSAVGTPFGAGNALFLDGVNDYTYLADSSDWHVSNGDFAVEVWVRFVAHTATGVFISQRDGSTTNHSFSFYWDTSLGIVFQYTVDGTTVVSVNRAWTPTNGVWYFVSVERAGTALRIKVDGSQLGADYTIGTATIFNSTAPLRIGATNSTPLAFFSGYVGPIRLTKAARTITAAPTAPFPRPTISGHVYDAAAAPVAKTILVRDRSTGLYLGGANSNPSTGLYTFYPPDFGEVIVERIDELANPYWNDVVFASRLNAAGFPTLTGQTLTATGTVTDSAAVADPFGGAQKSALFTGAGSYLSTGASAALLPGTVYTVQGWIRLSTLASPESGVLFIGTFGSNTDRTQIEVLASGAIEFYATGASAVFDAVSAASVIAANTWYHFAAVRNGANADVYVGGALVASAVASGTEPTGTNLHLGYCRSASTTRGMDGRLFDVQFSHRAEYLAPFTPPTSPFLVAPADGDSGENALIYDRVIPGG